MDIWKLGRKICITVEATEPMIRFSDGSAEGRTCFRTFCTDVYDDDNETKIGSIGGGTGFVTLSCGDEEWMIKHSDLWYAFQEALESAPPKVVYNKETEKPI